MTAVLFYVNNVISQEKPKRFLDEFLAGGVLGLPALFDFLDHLRRQRYLSKLRWQAKNGKGSAIAGP